MMVRRAAEFFKLMMQLPALGWLSSMVDKF
jgi:hypothetical protein